MIRSPFAVIVAALAIAAASSLSTAPAIAGDGAPAPTTYRFSLPGSVSGGATSFSLPGDLLTTKSRGDRQLGKVILADVIAKLTRLEADGRSVGGIVTVMGKTREMRGIPVLLDNGRVRVRVAQGRGSRSLVIPRAGAWSQTASCPAGYIIVTIASTPPTQMCAPIPT